MSARDDYPALAGVAQHSTSSQFAAALDEIDRLRADVSKLLAMLADTGVEWPEVRT